MDPVVPGQGECLSRVMLQAGHTLDWGCVFCPTNCTYAAPCGCGSRRCVDNTIGPPAGCISAAA